MGTITTAACNIFKADLFNGGHCFQTPISKTGAAVAGATTITGLSPDLTGISQSCYVWYPSSGPSAAVIGKVVDFLSPTSISISQPAPSIPGGSSIIFQGDGFKMSLIKGSPAGTFGAGTTNYSQLGADEVTGTGYPNATSNFLLNFEAQLSGSTAYVDFGDISWTGATFSFQGALISNLGDRYEGVFGRAVSVHNIGLTTVSSGVLTIVFPPPGTGAILTIA